MARRSARALCRDRLDLRRGGLIAGGRTSRIIFGNIPYIVWGFGRLGCAHGAARGVTRMFAAEYPGGTNDGIMRIQE